MPNRTMYRDTMLTKQNKLMNKKAMMTSAQNAKSKQINTQHVNCQIESIITNKSTIYQALPSWKMLNLKSKRCMKAQ